MSCAKTNLPLCIDHLLPREKGMEMIHYRWPVEIMRAHFALQVLNSKSLESFFKILNRTVVTL
jgi:hypothetical protein